LSEPPAFQVEDKFVADLRRPHAGYRSRLRLTRAVAGPGDRRRGGGDQQSSMADAAAPQDVLERAPVDADPASPPGDDEDEVDVFISPRRFGGSTPSAKVARDRAFRGSGSTIHVPPSPRREKIVKGVAASEDASYQVESNADSKLNAIILKVPPPPPPAMCGKHSALASF
jgi:hypothetical protein